MKKRAVVRALTPEHPAQDWSALGKGDQVEVLHESGEKYAAMVDAVDAQRTVIWIAADGSRERALYLNTDSDLITKI